MAETYTPTSIFGKRAIARLQPWETADLARFVDAAGKPFQKVLELAQEEGTQGEAGWVPGWGTLLNVNTCPAFALPFLAQFVGVELPKTATETEARALIKEEAGFERGTLQAIETACKRVAGSEFLKLLERVNAAGEEKAYHFVILVKKGISATIEAELKAAVERVKPGGVLFSIVGVENAFIEGGLKWENIGSGKKFSEMIEGDY